MTIIMFLVDTSASMNQRTYLGTTLLDVTKGAIETFMKMRSRDPQCKWDRYMLLTFEDPPANIKAGWKESHATLMNELKGLQANGLTPLGNALRNAFDLLNINRNQTGIDTYGQGRCPYYVEPALIVCFTDGRPLTTMSGVQKELNLPMQNGIAGSELTKEPFRWDQRLFGVVLRVPGTHPASSDELVGPPPCPATDTPLDLMCEVTGGRSFAVTSQRTLISSLEAILQRAQIGVVISFEKPIDTTSASEGSSNERLPPIHQQQQAIVGPNSISVPSCRCLIYVPRSAAQKGFSGHWPIPEAFWPDMSAKALPPRDAHPIVKCMGVLCDPPSMPEGLPFDKYEVEPSPLTVVLLERKQPSLCLPVFVEKSAKYGDSGLPFGYLKVSSNLQSVNLIVLPYNYPVALPLLGELVGPLQHKQTTKWRQDFESYLKAMPAYYAPPLRRALTRMVPNGTPPPAIPETMDNCLSLAVSQYLKQVKVKAKMEYDRLLGSVGQRIPPVEFIRVIPRSAGSVVQRRDFNELLQYANGDLLSMATLQQELSRFEAFQIAVPVRSLPNSRMSVHQLFRNPYDIPRKDLLRQLNKLHSLLLHPNARVSRLLEEERIHNMPVQQMGDYHEYLSKAQAPLRELETAPSRLHTFGNPFKVNKNLMIDEADEAMPGGGPGSPRVKRPSADATMPSPSSPSPGPKRRKPGPLPKDFPIRRPATPTVDVACMPRIADGAMLPPHLDSALPESPPRATSPPISVSLPVPPAPHFVANGYCDSALVAVPLAQDGSPSSSFHAAVTAPVTAGAQNSVSMAYLSQPVNGWLHATSPADLKRLLCKEVRRPGKNHDRLFGLLRAADGPVSSRLGVIDEVVREAQRFRRSGLVLLLQQFRQTVLHGSNNKSNSGSSGVSAAMVTGPVR